MTVVVLDLDETLVHASSTRSPNFYSFPCANLFVHVRPGALGLLQLLHEDPDKELCFWSVGTRPYVHHVCETLLDLAGLEATTAMMVLTREDATEVATNVFVKDLRKVDVRVEEGRRVLLLDDNPIHHVLCSHNRGRVIHVPPFEMRVEDDFLLELGRLFSKARCGEDAPPEKMVAHVSSTA